MEVVQTGKTLNGKGRVDFEWDEIHDMYEEIQATNAWAH